MERVWEGHAIFMLWGCLFDCKQGAVGKVLHDKFEDVLPSDILSRHFSIISRGKEVVSGG